MVERIKKDLVSKQIDILFSLIERLNRRIIEIEKEISRLSRII